MIRVGIKNRFMITVTLLRYDSGGYVDGNWVDVQDQAKEIQVSWQALKPSEYRLLPEGQSPLNVFQVYYNGSFSIGKEGVSRSDRLQKDSLIYKMLQPNNWTEGGHTTALFQEWRP